MKIRLYQVTVAESEKKDVPMATYAGLEQTFGKACYAALCIAKREGAEDPRVIEAKEIKAISFGLPGQEEAEAAQPSTRRRRAPNEVTPGVEINEEATAPAEGEAVEGAEGMEPHRGRAGVGVPA